MTTVSGDPHYTCAPKELKRNAHLKWVSNVPQDKPQLMFVTFDDVERPLCSGWIDQEELTQLEALMKRMNIKHKYSD